MENQYKYLGEILTDTLTVTQHLLEKTHQVEGLLKTCIFTTTNHVLSNIKMETLLNLYRACIIPALLYSSETWILTIEEENQLTRMQISIIRRILKIPISTPIVSIFLETGEIPITFEYHKRQLTYLWVLLNSNDQTQDIATIQLDEHKNNKGNLLNHMIVLLNKYQINESLQQIKALSKTKWKNILKQKMIKRTEEYCKTKSQNLSKLKLLNKYKTKPQKEQYIKKLTRSEASTIFKLRTRMTNVKSNYKNKHSNNLKCDRCSKENEDEQHLFERCDQLKLLQQKYKIKNFEEVFQSTEIERLKQIASFIKELGLE